MLKKVNLKSRLGERFGFTLMEVLIVVVIIGILAGLAIINYTGKIEQTKGDQAISNIYMIASALKIYFLKNSAEPPSSPLGPLGSITGPDTDINRCLNLSLADSYFVYNMNLTGLPSYWVTTANRTSGTYNGRLIRANLYSNNFSDAWQPTDAGSTWNWIPSGWGNI